DGTGAGEEFEGGEEFAERCPADAPGRERNPENPCVVPEPFPPGKVVGLVTENDYPVTFGGEFFCRVDERRHIPNGMRGDDQGDTVGGPVRRRAWHNELDRRVADTVMQVGLFSACVAISARMAGIEVSGWQSSSLEACWWSGISRGMS